MPAVALAGGLGLGGGREEGEKRERLKGSIPPLDFGEGGPQGGNPWRRAAVMVAPRWGSTAAKERRESEREAMGS